VLGAGCPRVTHPFAARAPLPKEKASLDLHVLSTPPAFVLSQDQTLREGIYDEPCPSRRREHGVSTQKVAVLATASITGPNELTLPPSATAEDLCALPKQERLSCSMYQRNLFAARTRPASADWAEP
jgi:hypothetical protein